MRLHSGQSEDSNARTSVTVSSSELSGPTQSGAISVFLGVPPFEDEVPPFDPAEPAKMVDEPGDRAGLGRPSPVAEDTNAGSLPLSLGGERRSQKWHGDGNNEPDTTEPHDPGVPAGNPAEP